MHFFAKFEELRSRLSTGYTYNQLFLYNNYFLRLFGLSFADLSKVAFLRFYNLSDIYL